MELDWELRPVQHHPRDWHEPQQPAAGPSTSAPPSAFAPSSILSQRRRSSAAHVRPAGPPPNLPIPSVPVSPTISHSPSSDPREELYHNPTYANGSARTLRSSSFARPGVSPNLAAVAAFSQSRHIPSMSHSPLLPSSSSIEDLSDPPPQSFLHSSPSRTSERQQDAPSDRLLLSPPEPRAEPRMPSSRRALTRALELAREAVQLDSMNDNPEAAVQAYGRSVALLSEVMERVRRGEDSTDSNRRRRRRSVAAQEEEVRRLQNIHDTYADRMNILSLIYSIPAVPYQTSSIYSTTTISTDSQSTSPTNSASPSSDASDQIPQHPYNTNHALDDSQYYVDDRDRDGDDMALFAEDDSSPTSGFASHPYAYEPPSQSVSNPPAKPTPVIIRTPTLERRARASSTLPPPPPPPSTSLPPAPVALEPSPDPPSSRHLDVVTRQRGGSIGHRRTGSGRLEALEEETEKHDEIRPEGQPRDKHEIVSRIDNPHLVPDTPRNPKRESHPLPPLPSPTSITMGSPGPPRHALPDSKPSLSPRSASVIAPRPRGASQLTTRSEFAGQNNLVNPTTNHGTIYKRRSKASAPPMSRSTSPTDSTASTGSIVLAKATASSLPGTTTPVLGGRSRSSSQPGRRPSLGGGHVSPLDQRPPLPGSSSVNGNGTLRKTSYPSKLNPNSQPSHLSLHTDLPLPISGPNSLGPQPPSFSNYLPTTPTSPLPPAPPTDPLRKPYHLMSLLRNTMDSPTGGYVTRRLHVPREVWSQGGAKLTNVLEKVRVVGFLCSALEDLQISSSDYFGAGNVSSGLALGIGSIGRKEGDLWLGKLEEFSSVCDGVVANFGKKLGVGEGFALKKTTWGNKFTRHIDKFTNGKNLDSPDAYVQGLRKLFLHAQLLDEHTKAVLAHPIAPAYAALPIDIRTSAEVKLKRASEFFASVVLTFVIRDLSQLLDKYAKKCEKWLAE